MSAGEAEPVRRRVLVGPERLREILRSSRHAVVFTGAGISTESGIPDYRSPGGTWSKFRPIEFDEFMASEEARRE